MYVHLHLGQGCGGSIVYLGNAGHEAVMQSGGLLYELKHLKRTILDVFTSCSWATLHQDVMKCIFLSMSP